MKTLASLSRHDSVRPGSHQTNGRLCCATTWHSIWTPCRLPGTSNYWGVPARLTRMISDSGWRANLAVKTGKPEEALRWLDAAILRRGDDPRVWRGLLEWARLTGRLDRAIEAISHLRGRPACARRRTAAGLVCGAKRRP